MATSPNDPRITKAINTATAWAKSQVGKATGNSIWAIAYPQWVGTGYHWCGGFVVAAYKQAGVPLMDAAWFFYTPYIKNLARKIGAWKTSGGNYGDLPLYDWQGDGVIDHVGISLPDPNSSQYRAVEGNTSRGNVGSQSAGGGCWIRYRPRTTISGWVDTRVLLAWMIDTGKWKPGNAPAEKDGFLMALSDKEQQTLAARIQNIQDILTGYTGNDYVKKGYSLPLVGSRVRDLKDYVTGGGPKGEDKTVLRAILKTQEAILDRLDALEGK